MPPALQNPFVLWFVLTAALAGLVYAWLRKELRVRAVFYGSFVIACLVMIWPPFDTATEKGKIHLGLDLRGGIHLVMQVVTDDALNATVDDSVQTLRDQLTRAGIVYGEVKRIDSRSFSVEGVEPARVKDARGLIRDYFPDREWQLREPADGGFLVRMNDPYVFSLKQRTVQEAIRTLERRVNQLGVSEPVIAEHGSTGDQILIQLPGVSDPEAAKRVITTTAQLALKLVEDEAPTRESLLESHGGKIPDGMEVVDGMSARGGQRTFYLVRREAVITGRDLKNARAGIDPQSNTPDVQFSLLPQGATKFKRETGRNIGRRLAIILDGSVESAPEIHSQISDSGVITGQFTAQEADELAKVLRAGALPATLRYLQELTVGASLGRDSIRSGVLASLVGMSLVALFMLFYYRLSGINAVVALAINLVILLGAMAYFGATLTLPGIAGVILTVGVGVDTNVLVFERIREELRAGRTVRAAVSTGFDRVWITIIDTHTTALIAAALLFQFGTGPIKGFAVTLFIGLVANVFASFLVSRFIFEWVLGKRQVASLSI
jgi:preprotein translocase subunit SecD